jgi:hypothetical protein
MALRGPDRQKAACCAWVRAARLNHRFRRFSTSTRLKDVFGYKNPIETTATLGSSGLFWALRSDQAANLPLDVSPVEKELDLESFDEKSWCSLGSFSLKASFPLS